SFCFFFFQAEDGIRDFHVTGVQTCALPICAGPRARNDRFVEFLRRVTQARQKDVVERPNFVFSYLRLSPPDLGKAPSAWNPKLRSEERRVGKEWRARGAP